MEGWRWLLSQIHYVKKSIQFLFIILLYETFSLIINSNHKINHSCSSSRSIIHITLMCVIFCSAASHDSCSSPPPPPADPGFWPAAAGDNLVRLPAPLLPGEFLTEPADWEPHRLELFTDHCTAPYLRLCDNGRFVGRVNGLRACMRNARACSSSAHFITSLSSGHRLSINL